MSARVLALVAALVLAVPAGAVEPSRRLVDVTSDVLAPGAWDMGLLWARYRRGVLPWLQLQTHLAGDAVGVLNFSAKALVLDRDELRLSVEAGATWVATALVVPSRPIVLFVPAEVRATVPLSDGLELVSGWTWRTTVLGGDLGTSWLRWELDLVRYDARGAWILTGYVPLLVRATASLEQVLGETDVKGVLVLDDLPAWGIKLSRELVVLSTTHLRVGLGYRNRPGILFYESLGYVLAGVDVFWR